MTAEQEARLKASNGYAFVHNIRKSIHSPYKGATTSAPCTLDTLKDIEILQSFAFWATDGYYFANQFSPCWMLVSADCNNPLDLSPIFTQSGFVPPSKVLEIHVPGIDGVLHPQSYGLLKHLYYVSGRNLSTSAFGRASQGINYAVDPETSTANLSILWSALFRLKNAFEGPGLGIPVPDAKQCVLNPCPYVAIKDRLFLKTPC